jgi:hypothetical protein
MEQNEASGPEIEEVMAATPTEASLRLQVTDLLLGGLHGVRIGRSTLKQGDVVQQIEAALEAYRSYFYSTEHHQWRDLRAACEWPGRRGDHAKDA